MANPAKKRFPLPRTRLCQRPVVHKPQRKGWFIKVLDLRFKLPLIPIIILLVFLVFPAIFAPFLAPHDPLDGDFSNRLTPPVWLEGGSWDNILGTDRAGRDIFSRIIYGSRISFVVAVVAIFSGGVIGTVLGLMAGYYGGIVEVIIMRFVDITFSIPVILLAMVLVVALGPSFVTVITVLIIYLWAVYARQIRGATLSIREMDFVARAKVAGASDARIIFGHILPNIANTLIVLATLQVGFVIIVESGLSFLGVGLSRPTPAWGLMVADGRQYVVSAWWVPMFPGLAIMIVVLAVNLLGDWLRDRLDPKLKQV